ncbi:MAG: DNA sulfur modification protein DndB [Candidatus Delongbacteria bacterium]|nr:DNA sulfur modification protein DndB [Candidatus Delongbacteria bacterium]
MKYSYNFPAIRGTQAGKSYYSFMCPLGIIHKLFVFDDDEIPPEHRAQRVLNTKRIPEITSYIIENPKDYVFSSLTASISGEHEFTSSSNDELHKDVGILAIDMESKLIINDGQHRRAAIEEAIKLNPKLRDETISIVLFIDENLLKYQQMFSDLNQHAVNVSNSIGILYDHRSPEALLTKSVIDSNNNLKKYTDMSNSSLAQKSNKLFTLSNFHKANLRLTKGMDIDNLEIQDFSKKYWSTLAQEFNEWQMVFKGEVSPYYSRQSSIASYGVVLEALGTLGNYLYSRHKNSWESKLELLNTINWSRTSSENWFGRCIDTTGKIVKNQNAILLTLAQIKSSVKIELTEKEQRLDMTFRKEQQNDN